MITFIEYYDVLQAMPFRWKEWLKKFTPGPDFKYVLMALQNIEEILF